jgi:hypothetical protein
VSHLTLMPDNLNCASQAFMERVQMGSLELHGPTRIYNDYARGGFPSIRSYREIPFRFMDLSNALAIRMATVAPSFSWPLSIAHQYTLCTWAIFAASTWLREPRSALRARLGGNVGALLFFTIEAKLYDIEGGGSRGFEGEPKSLWTATCYVPC